MVVLVYVMLTTLENLAVRNVVILAFLEVSYVNTKKGRRGARFVLRMVGNAASYVSMARVVTVRNVVTPGSFLHIIVNMIKHARNVPFVRKTALVGNHDVMHITNLNPFAVSVMMLVTIKVYDVYMEG